MKKKIIALSLITTMIVCNSMTVWAADTWTGSDGTSTYNKKTDGNNADSVTGDNQGGIKNVTGTYDLGTATESYNVEIVWGNMTCKMKTTGSPTSSWDAENRWYVINDFPGWESTDTGTADKITVNNRSNVAVKATFSGTVDVESGSVLKDTYGITSGSLAFTGLDGNNALNLATYEGASSVPTASSTVSVVDAIMTKAPSLKNTEGIVLGTVTVTIAKQ